ncbi:hypothetical protein C1646_765662 [Rhizophagus diaphanus]|nr:hypothetical protein C1646_765662 [Rhizophagus diaphanus] [Rhizophagus sp. MUCL 43196]
MGGHMQGPRLPSNFELERNQVVLVSTFMSNLKKVPLTKDRSGGKKADSSNAKSKKKDQQSLSKAPNKSNKLKKPLGQKTKDFEVSDLKVGLMGGVHDTIGKIFVNRIKDAIWYIDPHHFTLNACSCHLPILFTQLKTYQNGETYNQYYHSGHHKKIQLSQHKLLQLSSSLGLSISQPWASNDIWNQVVPAILSLYLNKATIIMIKHHHSNESACSPENNCIMYWTAACKRDNLKDKYKQLNDLLFEKQAVIWKPLILYEAEEFNDEHNETLKAQMLARIHEDLPHYFT